MSVITASDCRTGCCGGSGGATERKQWSLEPRAAVEPAPAPLTPTSAMAAAMAAAPTRRVAVGKNADGTMRFYEFRIEPENALAAASASASGAAANAKPPALVALTTNAQYGANPAPATYTVLPPKRFLPENKKKQHAGNTSKLSQVNARPAGASSNVAALQTQAALSFVGGTKGDQRVRRFGSGPRTVTSADDGMASFQRVFQGHGLKWNGAFTSDKQHHFRNWHLDPDYVKPKNDHPIKTGAFIK